MIQILQDDAMPRWIVEGLVKWRLVAGVVVAWKFSRE